MKTFWECVPLEHDAKVRRFSELRNYSQLFSRKTPVLLTQVKWVALQSYAPYVTELCSLACRAMLHSP